MKSASRVHVLAMLHAGPAGVDGLRSYETRALSLLEHGGAVLAAFVPESSESPETPDEIHLLEFPSRAALDAFRDDPRLETLAQERLRAIDRTTVYVSRSLIEYPE